MKEAFERKVANAKKILLSAKHEIEEYWVTSSPTPSLSSPSQDELDIFISHSSSDEAVAVAVIDLMRSALGIPAETIRCTSVAGYRLAAGANTDAELRREVYQARCFIGLITPASLRSQYVLFELGARWGASRHMVPLVAAGLERSDLRPPLSNLNAMTCAIETDLHQLLGDIARALSLPQPNASVYARQLKQLMEDSMRVARAVESDSESGSEPPGTRSEPVTEAAKELLSLIRSADVSEDKRGITEIFESLEPGMTYFLASTKGSGASFNMKSRIFREAIAELLSKGWLYPPEQDERVRIYEYKGPA
jgi:hypothetical protein